MKIEKLERTLMGLKLLGMEDVPIYNYDYRSGDPKLTEVVLVTRKFADGKVALLVEYV